MKRSWLIDLFVGSLIIVTGYGTNMYLNGIDTLSMIVSVLSSFAGLVWGCGIIFTKGNLD
jgi:hypothetical protein